MYLLNCISSLSFMQLQVKNFHFLLLLQFLALSAHPIRDFNAVLLRNNQLNNLNNFQQLYNN